MEKYATWGRRLLIGILFLVLYFEVIRPVRKWISYDWVLVHIQKELHTKYAASKISIITDPTGFTLENPDGHFEYSYHFPVGLFFILPGLFIILLFHRWKMLGALFLFHILTGLTITICFITGLAYSRILLDVSGFLQHIVIPVVSLAWIPVALFNQKSFWKKTE